MNTNTNAQAKHLLAFVDSHKETGHPSAYIHNGRLCVWTAFSDGTGVWEDADATMSGARDILGY